MLSLTAVNDVSSSETIHTPDYAQRYRSEWLDKIKEAGVRRRAEFYYQQLDALRPLRQQVRQELPLRVPGLPAQAPPSFCCFCPRRQNSLYSI